MTTSSMTAWVDACLGAAGRVRTGPLEPFRDRPWASIHRADTDAGPVWLKQTTPLTAAEVGLYEVLATVVPDRILVPLGIDLEGGRLLLPDSGGSAGDRFAGAGLTPVMERALAQYAGLQRDLSPHVDAMLAAGVTDMRPGVMPRRFDEALAGAADYVRAAGTDDERAGFARLEAMRGEFAGWCAELAAAPVPASLDHNDLHPYNVLPAPDGRSARFYDWGDAVVAHPFSSLIVALDTAPEGSEGALREAYLTVFGDPAELAPVADLATRVGQVARALVWQRALGDAPHDHPHASARVRNLLRLLPEHR